MRTLSIKAGLIALSFSINPATQSQASIDYTQAVAIQEEVMCLADNIYWEARNQSRKGQIAVGNVTLNRVSDNRFPSSVCEVVYQGKHRPSWKDNSVLIPIKNACQFSWYCDGKPEYIPEKDRALYKDIVALSWNMVMSRIEDITDGALFYHADYVTPYWASTKNRTVQIDDHIFYAWN